MKKKILFINGHLDVGGCERSLVDVLNNMNFDKYEIDLLLLEHIGDYANEIPKEVNIYLYSLDKAFGSLLSCFLNAFKRKDGFSLRFRIFYVLSQRFRIFYRKLKKLFKNLKKEYDVIVAYRPGICTELAAYILSGKKRISWWHHGEMNFSGKSAEKLHEAYRKMDIIVAVSSNCRELLKENFPDICQKLVVIPNMIIPEELRKKALEYPVNEVNDKLLKIISVGRMTSEKNMIFCPKIAKKLKARGIDFIWFLIGEGVEKKNITDMIKEFGLEKNIILLGGLKNPYPYIFKADMMVHPSLVESQGITILESMALSTPVIAVKSQGPQEFIVSGENGYLVKASVMEMVEMIEYLYREPENMQKIIKNALKTVQKFEKRSIMKRVEKIMEE